MLAAFLIACLFTQLSWCVCVFTLRKKSKWITIYQFNAISSRMCFKNCMKRFGQHFALFYVFMSIAGLSYVQRRFITGPWLLFSSLHCFEIYILRHKTNDFGVEQLNGSLRKRITVRQIRITNTEFIYIFIYIDIHYLAFHQSDYIWSRLAHCVIAQELTPTFHSIRH